ncbi:related to FMO1 Flavin-containing monooxygenase [Lecanosticta acicola]|uniref:Related to FMO1 Flavin-containing monooxygenase n=1 Tax=Lecanosticta acicola TaxID=111012 RepID=A0AAI8Z927_9PEZI|nr:related to FMO1 Flavin-containing monooxygenase [Lecanosticta acicola]
MKTVCIVGAGPSGLVGAKVLLKTNKFNVSIFDKADRLGGIWALDENSTGAFLSPQTPTNLSRFTVGFSDLDWSSVDLAPREGAGPNGAAIRCPPMFPKAWQVNRYLEAYRQKYIPDGIIRYRHEVTDATRVERGGTTRWSIVTRDEHSQESTSEYDYLLLGSGFFAKPRPLSHSIPDLPSDLSVKAIHSSQFRELDDLFPKPGNVAGKRILVVGGGNSAGEAAAAVAQQLSNINHSPQSIARGLYKDCSIVHVTARPLYALPPYTPTDQSNTTFVPLDLKLYDLSKRPSGPIVGNAGPVTKAVKDMIHNALQTTIGGNQGDLGASALAIPAEEPRSTVYVALSESYPEFVRSGLIDVVGGRVTAIENAADGTVTARVTTGDESQEITDIGAIIYANGYSPQSAVDFLGDDDIKKLLHYDPGSLRLPLLLQNWQTMAEGIPELALLGFYEGPYWPMMEMQARLTADRWLCNRPPATRTYEEMEKLLELRQTMQKRDLHVPQYWFGDYAGYLEEIATHLDLQRNDGAFAEREGCVSPARYLSHDSDRTEADAIMRDLHQVWRACTEEGKYVARAIFRAMQGHWNIQRTIDSSLPSFPSGTLTGEASFHPRVPTSDTSGKSFDLEYLYIESGDLVLSNGASMPARRRYVYRYSEERDELSVWFVKPDRELEVDYLFHNLAFVGPAEARKEEACVAKADHLCVEDMYWTEYRFPMRGISLPAFETLHTVRGPSKDYVATTKFTRPSKTQVTR